MASEERELFEKLLALPPEKLAEVEDFVDFLQARESHSLAQAMARISEAAFARVWENSDDAAYDAL